MLLDIERLNADCACISLDRKALCDALAADVGSADFCRSLTATHPTLISSLPVFVSAPHLQQMHEAIEAIEHVVRSEAYQQLALADAPDIARHDTGAVGVLMGYDFHLAAEGPRLIEVNTNAGGALINAYIERAQKACCAAVEPFFARFGASKPDTLGPFVDMFRQELRRVRGETAALKRIAIVDEAPEQQYLYPEFVLFRELFRHHGIEAVIAAPHQLEVTGGVLNHQGDRIDLVYNRLTDFMLDQPASKAIGDAYLTGTAVVTPNPRAHVLLADKRNLVRLSDPVVLSALGIDRATIGVLARAVPRTVMVTGENAGELWAKRARLFFKPQSGFASRAAYRGDKLTRRVWEEIRGGGYVAQDLVPPSSRTVIVDGEAKAMKVDIRNYTYDGKVLLHAARLYQGQTTNFRTPGGGFAPVLTQ